MKNYRPEIISARSCSACNHFALDFTLDQKGKVRADTFRCGTDPEHLKRPVRAEVMTCDDFERRKENR